MSNLPNDRAWYILSRIEGLGPKRLHLIHRALRGSDLAISDVFDLTGREFQQLLPSLAGTFFPRIKAALEGREEHLFDRLREQAIEIVHLGHEWYPTLLTLRLGDNAPPLLYCRGAIPLLASEGIAIVGSRHASATSRGFAATIAGQLAENGRNVISGYAAGIDSAAHTGSLQADGTTTIVLAAGIHEFAPKRDIDSVMKEDNTLVLSQFSPEARWNARNAMARNKLVCALALAVLVIEAGQERDEQGRMSGTFDTGRTALELDVPLFVLDPDDFDISPPGNAELLKRGGKVVRREDALGHILHKVTLSTRPENEARPMRLF